MTIVIKWIVVAGGMIVTLVAGFYIQTYGRLWFANQARERDVMAYVASQGESFDGGAKAIETRQRLTNAMIDFYNFTAEDELTDDERSQILWGVEHEGIALRAAHHQDAARWAHASVEQSRPFYRGVYTWEQGIYEYSQGNRERAYEALGHTLHLMEDVYLLGDQLDKDIDRSVVMSMVEQGRDIERFNTLDDAMNADTDAIFDVEEIIRVGAGIITFFHRETQNAGGGIVAPPTMYSDIPTPREFVSRIGHAVQSVVAQTPRILGARPEAPIVVEATPQASAAVQHTRSVTRAEAARISNFFVQLIRRPVPSPHRPVALKPRAQPKKITPVQDEPIIVVPVENDIPPNSPEPLPPPPPEPLPPIEQPIPTPLDPVQIPEPTPPPAPLIVYCCSGGGGGGGGGSSPPQQPPSAITDLRLQEQPFITNSVTFLWTAPSDPDTAQTNLVYNLRTATTTPITDIPSFESATAATSGPIVGAAGAAESFVLANLMPGTTYTVALRTSDGTNISALSNIVTFTTLPKGDAPTQIADFAMIDEYVRYPLVLQWTSPTDPETNYTNPTPQLSYEIRYAAGSITDDASWAAATLLTNLPTPANPGTVQTYVFTPLTSNTAYTFAIRMSDGYQLGPISNIITHTSAWFGAITTTTTWAATASPVYVTGNVRFEAPLTIEPGVTVKIGEFSKITLAAPVTATGTTENPIAFTSFSTTAAQYWQSLILDSGSTGSSLAYVTIEKGGNVDGTLTAPMVDIRSGTSTINQSTIQSSLGTGIMVIFPARPTLTNVTVTNNAKNGVWYTGALDASYTLPAVPQPVFTGTVTVASGATLTMSDGTVLKMDLAALLLIDGTLNISGTSMTLVTVTSLRDDTIGTDPTPTDTTAPSRGDWQAIRFRSGSIGTLTSVVLRYGGSQTSSTNTDAGMMKVENATVTLDDFWFAQMNYGLEVHGAASTVELRRTIFLNTEAPIDPVYSLWNNPESLGIVHYVRINPTFVGIPPVAGTYTGNASVEYITIDNLGSEVEVLTGWKIFDLANNTFTFPTFTLGVGTSVIVHTGSGTNSATDLYWGRGLPVWNESSDFATLKNNVSVLIDEVAYE